MPKHLSYDQKIALMKMAQDEAREKATSWSEVYKEMVALIKED